LDGPWPEIQPSQLEDTCRFREDLPRGPGLERSGVRFSGSGRGLFDGRHAVADVDCPGCAQRHAANQPPSADGNRSWRKFFADTRGRLRSRQAWRRSAPGPQSEARCGGANTAPIRFRAGHETVGILMMFVGADGHPNQACAARQSARSRVSLVVLNRTRRASVQFREKGGVTTLTCNASQSRRAIPRGMR